MLILIQILTINEIYYFVTISEREKKTYLTYVCYKTQKLLRLLRLKVKQVSFKNSFLNF